jgi:tetratricopeptide (TPR) repeat protein
MTSIGVLPASISTAHAQSPAAAKCNAAGNISLDDRIAGCTVVIETATAMPQSVIFAYFRRAGFYLQKGDVDRAIADYDQIIEHDPNNPIARLRRASAYFRKREFDAALADYDKAVELDPKDEYAYSGRAGAYMAKEDIDRATADYGRVLLLHPDNFSAYVGRGLAYNAEDQPDRALADCNRAIEISPEHGTGQFCRGHVYIAKGNPELALADFSQAIQFNPRDPRFYLGRASVFRARGDFEQALSNITQAIDLARTTPISIAGAGPPNFKLAFCQKLSMISDGRPSSIRRTSTLSSGSTSCDRRVASRASWMRPQNSSTCLDGLRRSSGNSSARRLSKPCSRKQRRMPARSR